MAGNSQDGTGDALVEHWKRMAEKHLVNENTAGALRAACTKVLGVFGDDWKGVDVRSLDVDDVLLRFQNKHHKDLTPQSLATYQSRFKTALNGYLEYLENPSGWRPKASKAKVSPVRPRPDAVSPSRSATVSPAEDNGDADDGNFSVPADTLTHRFPLSDGSLATLVLPVQLRKADVRRLTAFLDALAFEDDAGSAPRALMPGPSPEAVA